MTPLQQEILADIAKLKAWAESGTLQNAGPLLERLAQRVAERQRQDPLEQLVATLEARAAGPDDLEHLTGELDCCPGCEHVWHDYAVNAGGCRRSERAEYCPNDLAEILRAVAELWRAVQAPTRARAPEGRR